MRWQPPGIDRPVIAIVPMEELVAGKLHAALDRCMPRDLFDVMRLPGLAGEVWETPRMRRVHVALAATLPHPLYDYASDRFDRVSERQVREQLLPMLQVDQPPTADSLFLGEFGRSSRFESDPVIRLLSPESPGLSSLFTLWRLHRTRSFTPQNAVAPVIYQREDDDCGGDP